MTGVCRRTVSKDHASAGRALATFLDGLGATIEVGDAATAIEVEFAISTPHKAAWPVLGFR